MRKTEEKKEGGEGEKGVGNNQLKLSSHSSFVFFGGVFSGSSWHRKWEGNNCEDY